MIKKQKFAPKNVFKLHKDTILAVYSPDGPAGKLLYSGSKDGCIRILDLGEKKVSNTILLSKTGPQLDTNVINSGIEIGELQKIALETIQKIKVTEDLTSILFTKNTVYGSYENGDIYCWDLQSGGEILYQINNGHRKAVKQLIQLNAQIFLSSSDDDTIRLWDIPTGKCLNIIKLAGPITQVLVHANLLYILLGHNIISILNTETLELVDSLTMEGKYFVNLLVDNNTFFLATTDKKIEVFERKGDALEPQYTLEGHKDWVLCMKVHNNHLYSGSDDKTIKVWSLEKKISIEDFTDHEDGVSCLEFCDNSVYSASFDNTIRFWRIEEMFDRILDRKMMAREELMSKKMEAYYKVLKGRK